MLFFVQDDCGVLQISFGGLTCNICDAASYDCLENCEKYMSRVRGNMSLRYFTLDSSTGIVAVYAWKKDEPLPNICLPLFKFNARNRLFYKNCDLLTLYNLFAPKKLRIYCK